MRMGLREANQRFSLAVKAVKAGRQVILTERGKPIAVIKPLPKRVDQTAVIQRLIAEGLLLAGPKSGPLKRGQWKPARIRGVPLSTTVREERDAR